LLEKNRAINGFILMNVCHRNKAPGRRPGSGHLRLFVLVGLVAVLFFTTGAITALDIRPAWAEPLTAKAILDKVDDLYRGTSSHGKMTMEVVTAHWRRTLSLEFWSKGKDKSLIRILSPLKEKGTATLRSGNEIWNYLPKVNRVIKLPSSMMSASWMGSHFTNDDLVKESRFSDDYTFKITHEGARDGVEIVELTCTPKPEAPVVWGKVDVTVRRSDFLPIVILYYDENMHLARTMTFSRVKEWSGRKLPTVMTLTPADKPGEKTTITYQEIHFDVSLSDEIFSLRNLQE
jgi:outer membrane lipoprotein-sorting protein